MKVIELVEKSSNCGNGKIRIQDTNDYTQNKLFNGLDELEKSDSSQREVEYWEFVPIRQLNASGWEFILEIGI